MNQKTIEKSLHDAIHSLTGFFDGYVSLADRLYMSERLEKWLTTYKKGVQNLLLGSYEAGERIESNVGLAYKYSYIEKRTYKKSANIALLEYAPQILPELNITATALGALKKKGILTQEQIDNINAHHSELGEPSPRFTSSVIKEEVTA
ncbi:MAG: hypothetical protein LW809_03310 [Vampirovibrionales bacterium]|jgi:hypothetical protein|nr:hypothetical protein [Vampirovibrionales bacterium]